MPYEFTFIFGLDHPLTTVWLITLLVSKRYCKTAMVGLFKGLVDVMGFIRTEGVRFSSVKFLETK